MTNCKQTRNLLAQCMRLVICEFINLFQNYNPNYHKYLTPERGG